MGFLCVADMNESETECWCAAQWQCQVIEYVGENVCEKNLSFINGCTM